MKKLQFIYVLLIIALLFACRNNSKSGENKRDTSAIITVSIPSNYLMFSADEMDNWLCHALQIPVLNNTYSGMQLRIHEGYRDDTGHLVLLKDSNNHWAAELFNYKVDRNDSGKMHMFSYQHIALGHPKSGWKEFTNKFSEFDLENLQTQRTLIDQFDTESVVMDVEIVNEHRYTHNNFGDPYKSKKPKVKKVVAVVNFLKEEFQIK